MTSLRYPEILKAVANEPWAILPEKLDAIVAFLAARAAGADPDPQAAGIVMRRDPGDPARVGGVEVIPVFGTLTHRRDQIRESSGLTSAERITAQVQAAVADSSVSAILLDVNSPGGTVAGMPEVAAELRRAREQKELWAFVNPLAASSAYWIASQASRVVVTPSGSLGHIGVFVAHADVSRALERQGVTVTMVGAGKHKLEGHPALPLSEEAQAALQERVDSLYGMFVRDVAAGRGVTEGTVRSGFGEGRLVLAGRAVELGMADRIATFGETLAELTAKQGPTVPRASGGQPRGAMDTTETAGALGALAKQIRSMTGGR